MKMNREMIEFLFDFSGLDFTESDRMERDRLVGGEIFEWNEAIFTIKADKVEHLLNKLRMMAEES
ncbi:hypothetical protein LCGC14_0650350 [marine sediment metagenome]|uniref:Uncharacterized protein n=1 Tax=marine sediment metagenome TaxID=412755 RepID=A0A0F9TIB9_9ZZZZ|nr:hypothetical protein [Candidatus Aminicenantes bacterium]